MVRAIKVWEGVDKALDLVPVFGSLKNMGVKVYQKAYKADKAASPIKPVNTSWTSDLKIHAILKPIPAYSLIPIFGEIYHLVMLIIDKTASKRTRGYLTRAVTGHEGALNQENQLEVVKLYLARNPNREESKLRKALDLAVEDKDKFPILKAILDSRSSWSEETIIHLLKYASSIAAIRLLLPENLAADQFVEIIEHLKTRKDSPTNFDIIDFLLSSETVKLLSTEQLLTISKDIPEAQSGLFRLITPPIRDKVLKVYEQCTYQDAAYFVDILKRLAVNGCHSLLPELCELGYKKFPPITFSAHVADIIELLTPQSFDNLPSLRQVIKDIYNLRNAGMSSFLPSVNQMANALTKAVKSGNEEAVQLYVSKLRYSQREADQRYLDYLISVTPPSSKIHQLLVKSKADLDRFS